MRYLTLAQSTHLALARKRRMRLIYKWRHGLAHTNQPRNRDRGKLAILAMANGMMFDNLIGRIIAPVVAYWERQIAEGLYQ